MHPDLIFLQEVQGQNALSELSQFEYLAQEIWPHFTYGKNAVYEKSHHGNAILSKYPILSWENIDLSTNRVERRGLLHALIQLPWQSTKIHTFCTHLDLSERGRKKQLASLSSRIHQLTSSQEPLLLAGDFNDWRQSAHTVLERDLALQEVFRCLKGECPKTFPSFFPMLALDRIYFRGVEPSYAQILSGYPWKKLSDHLPLAAEFRIRFKAPGPGFSTDGIFSS